MILRIRIIIISLVALGIYTFYYMNIASIENNSIVDNSIIDITNNQIVDDKDMTAISIKNNASEIPIVKNESIVYTDDLSTDILENIDSELVDDTNFGIEENNLNTWMSLEENNKLESSIPPTNYSYNLKSEGLEFHFYKPIKVNNDNSIKFGPVKQIPESPTDRVYTSHIYYLSIGDKRTYENIVENYKTDTYIKPIKKNIGNFEVIIWNEGGMCDYRVYEILGIYNNIRLTSGGCHTSKEEDYNLFNTLIKNIVISKADINYIEHENYKIIYEYYNKINNKDYSGAFELKDKPGYELSKFIEIYNTVSDIEIDLLSKNNNTYNLIITLVDSGMNEKYNVTLLVNNGKIITMKTIEIK